MHNLLQPALKSGCLRELLKEVLEEDADWRGAKSGNVNSMPGPGKRVPQRRHRWHVPQGQSPGIKKQFVQRAGLSVFMITRQNVVGRLWIVIENSSVIQDSRACLSRLRLEDACF